MMTERIAIRTTVKPFPLEGVKEEHLLGIFGDFAEVVEARIEELRKHRNTGNAERIRFWEFALRNLDHELHAKIQRKYLVEGSKIRFSDLDQDEPQRRGMYVKYIDPVKWLESKLRFSWDINLHRSAPLDILDIGTGPGHFPFVARFYGHDVLGLDRPEEVNEEGQTFLYDDLCKFYGVKRIPCAVLSGCDLPDTGKRYDLVTSFLTAFNAINNPQNPTEFRLWTPDEWREFIDACREVWLKPGGRIVMTLARRKVTEDCWDYLASRAERVIADKCFVEIRFPAEDLAE